MADLALSVEDEIHLRIEEGLKREAAEHEAAWRAYQGIIRAEYNKLIMDYGREYLYLYDKNDTLILHLDCFGEAWLDPNFQGENEVELGGENPYFWQVILNWSGKRWEWYLDEIPYEFYMFSMSEEPRYRFETHRDVFDYIRHKIERFIANPYTTAELLAA